MMLLPYLDLGNIYNLIDFSKPTGNAVHSLCDYVSVPSPQVWQLDATDHAIPVFVCP